MGSFVTSVQIQGVDNASPAFASAANAAQSLEQQVAALVSQGNTLSEALAKIASHSANASASTQQLTGDMRAFNEGVSGASQNLADFNEGVTKAGAAAGGASESFEEFDHSTTKARYSAQLLGRELGIPIPRALSSIAAQSAALGPIMEAMLPLAVLGIGIDLIVKLAGKLGGFVDDIGGWSAKTKSEYAVIAAENEKLYQSYEHVAEEIDHISNIGATGFEASIRKEGETATAIARVNAEINKQKAALEQAKTLGAQAPGLKGLWGGDLTAEEAFKGIPTIEANIQRLTVVLRDLTQVKKPTEAADTANTAAKDSEKRAQDQAKAAEAAIRTQEQDLNRRNEANLQGRNQAIQSAEEYEKVIEKIQHEGAEQQLKAAESNERGLEQITRRRTKFILDAAKEQHHAYEEDQKLDEIHMQAQVEHEKRLFDIEKERLDAEVEAGQITVRQKIAQLQQIADAEHAVTLDSLNQKRANVDAGDPRKDANERAKIDAQIEAETDAHDKKMAQLSAEAIKEMEAPYKQFFQQVSGQFNSFVDGIVVQHQKMRQAAQQLWRGLESDAINAILKVAEKYIEQHLVMAAAHKIFQATNKAVDVAAAAAHNAANATQAESDIGVSAAEVFFEAIEAIPFPANLVAAPAAAADVWASGQPYVAAASAAGGWDMPSGGPFPMIGHSREMMLPEKHADTIRNLGESGSGHTFVFHQAPGSSPDNVRQSTRAFVEQIRKAARQGLLTPA